MHILWCGLIFFVKSHLMASYKCAFESLASVLFGAVNPSFDACVSGTRTEIQTEAGNYLGTILGRALHGHELFHDVAVFPLVSIYHAENRSV